MRSRRRGRGSACEPSPSRGGEGARAHPGPVSAWCVLRARAPRDTQAEEPYHPQDSSELGISLLVERLVDFRGHPVSMAIRDMPARDDIVGAAATSSGSPSPSAASIRRRRLHRCPGTRPDPTASSRGPSVFPSLRLPVGWLRGARPKRSFRRVFAAPRDPAGLRRRKMITPSQRDKRWRYVEAPTPGSSFLNSVGVGIMRPAICRLNAKHEGSKRCRPQGRRG